MIHKKVSYKDYYSNPDLIHRTGDIWKDLPSFGLLKGDVCRGLIITPACDLANNKVETITFLPIITLNEYLVSRPFYSVLLKKIINLASSINSRAVESLLNKNFLPSRESIKFIISEYEKLKYPGQSNRKNTEIIERIVHGLQLILDICSNNIIQVNKELLQKFISEKEYNDTKEKIIRNNFSSDLHFLPRDEQDPQWSAILDHSVALFRYPITVSIEIMDTANDITIGNWNLKIDELREVFPMAIYFKNICPVKVARLHDFFLSDLLTRFATLYIRVGSPDFDSDTITRFSKQI